MILVTSAAGHTGRIMVHTLVTAGYDAIATDIDPKVQQLPGIKQALVGDLTQLAFQQQLVASADQIVYIPPLFSAEEALIGENLIDLSAAGQVKQFVFVSVTHPILTTLLQHTAKRDVEEHLIYQGMTSQLPYTILQPMHYMHNFDPQLVHRTGKYQIFYNVDSKIAYVDPKDVAEVLVQVIGNIAQHNKATYELVGTQPFSPNELVQQYNALTGEQAVAEYVDVETFLDTIDAQDLFFRTGFKHLADTYSKWGLDGNSTVLRLLLGRQPTDFKTYVKRQLN
ncbi:NmrA family protein [Secundilactobacillus paracollinoides]|uniref:NmrA family protein n=1 Tax=Secundilactobacillus paracollinoides TaxID=240427 RepID=A0A1B2J1U5_9LACO|nr:NmrA family NAD(P)-binding protein [Secundilactobacillus paracollinoides]ANZ62365.1 NmrA family protein [Secundilactobacillus paracollinoides]ANZ63202.1 NmrA family protein [Secundilactobacillus paracollinoides]ANZ68316.1 NmrA family protein [Secundilactobacillus paracollinoides]